MASANACTDGWMDGWMDAVALVDGEGLCVRGLARSVAVSVATVTPHIKRLECMLLPVGI